MADFLDTEGRGVDPRIENDPVTDHSVDVETTVLGADEIIINMGPQHPSTHGVLRVKLKLDGEKVVGSECIIGYLHRGVEKIAEHRTYQQFAPYVDRMDYVAAVSNGLGLLRSGRKVDGCGSAAARARDSHHSHGVAAHRVASGLAGNTRAGHWRADSGVLLLPRTRRNSENF